MEKITVPELIKLSKDYYLTNSTGGNLHIVLDDGNIENGHIEFCIEEAKSKNDVKGVELGNLLLTASKTQRRKLTRNCHLYLL